MIDSYVREIINDIKKCAFYRLSLEHEISDKILAKQVQKSLQNKGFDVNSNKNMLIIKWDGNSTIRNVANLNKNNDELCDYNKIRSISIAAIDLHAEYLKGLCLTGKKYLIHEKMETINVVKSLIVDNMYQNDNEPYIVIDKINKHNTSLFDLEIIKQIVEAMRSDNYHHDIELSQEYNVQTNVIDVPYFKTYLTKYFITGYPRKAIANTN